MAKKLIKTLIEATRQERRRIEDPKNRSRYFMFSKVEERHNAHGYSVTFEKIHDRILRDARWKAGQESESLFRVGDFFVPGLMEITPRGMKISFRASELGKLNVDIAAVKRITDIGIDYVIDSRELMDNLLSFLEKNGHEKNQFLDPLTKDLKAIPIRPIARMSDCGDLNLSQQKAIEKALRQKVTFVWGPPGTGKTKTLGALAASLIKGGKRVLLTALSNMAMDQLFLMAVERLGESMRDISIARMGSTMADKCQCFGREQFLGPGFGARKAGMSWSDHVRNASLVAANFTMLTLPRTARTGLFDYVIADEVSMANIPSLIVASFFAKVGVVVGGDPLQLPPIYPDDADEPSEWFQSNIFEKARVTERDDPRAAFLNIQYRMQDEIGELVSQTFYNGALETGTTPLPKIKGFDGRVVFQDKPGHVESVAGSPSDADTQRRFNVDHARSVAEAVFTAINHGIRPSEIGVIAPYNAQVMKIREKIHNLSRRRRVDTKGVLVSTIHSFQGQDRRVIIIDFTDSNVMPSSLTAKKELINVALSRAREQLIIIGNKDYLLNEYYFSPQEIEMFGNMLARARTHSGHR